MQNQSWPPRDPAEMHEGDPDKEFVLPDSPWTYENGSVNPDLQPNITRRRNNGASSLPPYHPDYRPGGDATDAYSTDDDEYDDERADNSKTRVRRGSEGYEVRPGAREDILARYLSEIGEKYHRYIPQPDSDSESDDIPLGRQR